MSKGIILSLCDFSGAWSRPFIALGYTVVRVDPMHDAGRMTTEGTTIAGSAVARRMADGGFSLAATAGQLADYLAGTAVLPHGQVIAALIRNQLEKFDRALCPVFGQRVVGVLAAPPCTHFAGSGARWWAGEDARGETAESVQIVRDCLRVVDLCKPDWWALENPVGRIARLVPELRSPGVKFFAFDPCDYAGLAEGDPLTEAYTKRTCLWGVFNARHLRDLAVHRWEPVMIERTKALRSKTPSGFARAFAAAQAA